jgi:predicted hydrolase (HD superfamily)
MNLMSLSYDEAEAQLRQWTSGPSLLNHAQAVSLVMRRAAHRYGRGADDELDWAIAGLLHDADYERWPDEHPHRIVAWLRDRGEEAIAHAVAAHVARMGLLCESPLDKALLACDELTGFVMACALVRPDGLRTLGPSSVKKKLKDRSFAAKVDRSEIHTSVEQLGANLDEHIQLVIDALIPHAEMLGLAGRKPEQEGA